MTRPLTWNRTAQCCCTVAFSVPVSKWMYPLSRWHTYLLSPHRSRVHLSRQVSEGLLLNCGRQRLLGKVIFRQKNRFRLVYPVSFFVINQARKTDCDVWIHGFLGSCVLQVIVAEKARCRYDRQYMLTSQFKQKQPLNRKLLPGKTQDLEWVKSCQLHKSHLLSN